MYQRLNLLEIELLLLEIKQKALIEVDEPTLQHYTSWIEKEIEILKKEISQIRLKLFPVEDQEDL